MYRSSPFAALADMLLDNSHLARPYQSMMCARAQLPKLGKDQSSNILEQPSLQLPACSQVSSTATANKQTHPASRPVAAINPVGASSNYSNTRLQPVGTAQQGQSLAAPSSSQRQTGAYAVSTSNVDTARHGDAATTSIGAAPDGIASQVDHPGLSGPQDAALPAYQLEAQGRAGGQKGGARDLNKPQDPVGTAVEPGSKAEQGAAVGSAERPIHVAGATDLPHGTAVEPSYQSVRAQGGKADESFHKAAQAFAKSPTEAESGL